MGRPVVHWEMWSEQPAALAEFYQDVFDWQINAIAQMNYHMVDTASDEPSVGGGIMQPNAGEWPGNMALYIDVDDLAAYRERIINAGGSILVDEQDIPGMGKLCLFKDPDDRVCGLWQKIQ